MVKYHMCIKVPKMTFFHKFVLYENVVPKNNMDIRIEVIDVTCVIFLTFASIASIGNPIYLIM